MMEHTMIERSAADYMSGNMSGNILVVDDDQDILDSLKDMLVIGGGYNVETASDEVSARKIMNYFQPDITLLDIRLGQTNGLDLLSCYKQESPDVDYIMMTAYREVDYAVSALRNGASEFLFKPIDPTRLLETLKGFFQKREIKKEKIDQERYIKTILEQASGFIFLLDSAGRCIEASSAALSFINQPRDKVIDMPFWKTPWLSHSRLLGEQLQEAISRVSNDQSLRMEVEMINANAQKVWFDISLKTVFDKEREVSMIIVEAHDLTEHKEIEKKLQKMALYDPLTGLANRILLCEHLESTLAHAVRNNTQFSVLFIDLDQFKAINDSFGHQVGDEVLINMGSCLKACLREEDLVARVGGDEFVVVLSSEIDNEGSKKAAERLLHSVSELALPKDQQGIISASIGIAEYPANGLNIEVLLNNADEAMYEAKKKGKNCFEFFAR